MRIVVTGASGRLGSVPGRSPDRDGGHRGLRLERDDARVAAVAVELRPVDLTDER